MGAREERMKKFLPGTQVKITLKDGDSFTGIIQSNEDEWIVLDTDDGEEEFDYSMVGRIKELSSAGESPAPASPVVAPVTPQPVVSQKPVVAPAPPKPVIPQTYYFLGKAVQYESLKKRALLIDALFKGMEKADKKRLNVAYNQFCSGVKANDNGKIRIAATRAKDIIWDGRTENSQDWSLNALQLTAHMLEWARLRDADMYEDAQCWYEGAIALYEKQEYQRAANCAAKALADAYDDPKMRQNMLIILAESIVKTDDASLLTTMNGVDGLHELEADLLRNKGCSAYERDRLQLVYANSVKKAEPEEVPVQEEPVQVEPVADDRLLGVVSKLSRVREEGEITGTDGKTYRLLYHDIMPREFYDRLMKYRGTDMSAKTFWVEFKDKNGVAKDIVSVISPVSEGNSAINEKKYWQALSHYRKVLGTKETGNALLGMCICAVELYDGPAPLTEEENEEVVALCAELADLCDAHADVYPQTGQGWSRLAQTHAILKNYTRALAYAEKAINTPDLPCQMLMTFLAQYARIGYHCAQDTGEVRGLPEVIRIVDRWEKLYDESELKQDPTKDSIYGTVLAYRCRAACMLNEEKKARQDLEKIRGKAPYITNWMRELETMVNEAGQRVKAAQELAQNEASEEAPVSAEVQPEEMPVEAPEQPQDNTADAETEDDVLRNDDADTEESFDDEPDDLFGEDVDELLNRFWRDNNEKDPVYQDTDGWAALKTTCDKVAAEAIDMGASGRIPAMTAYLRAAAELNPQMKVMYRTVALAANAPDREKKPVDELMELCCQNDGTHSVLNDYCFASAILRTAYMSNRADEVESLCEQTAVFHQMPEFANAYEVLMAFSREANVPANLYASYRNHATQILHQESEENRDQARKLYAQLYESPARETLSLQRMIETRKILFSTETELARMLRGIIQEEHRELIRMKDHFAETYLSRGESFAEKRINQERVDAMINECWELAGTEVGQRKKTSVPQGGPRNNMRSQLTNVLETILRWYVLDEESSGQTQCTEQGWALYRTRSEEMAGALRQLAAACGSASTAGVEDQAGRHMLKRVADELLRRMNGSWKTGEEKYFYADFLYSDYVMLDENFMPETKATLCVLPDFNVLARIRRHVAAVPMTLQEHMDRIYGEDLNGNNYGMARRMLEYAEFKNILVSVPEDAEVYENQSAYKYIQNMQTFRERYQLVKSQGGVMKSDAFCNYMEEIIRYWYVFNCSTRNYGFQIELTREAEGYLHQVAQRFENQLYEQLDVLIANKPQFMNRDPKIIPMIRDQIAQHNFSVAEDWMTQAASGRLSVEVNPPEALVWLDDFMSNHARYFEMIGDSGRNLNSLFRLRGSHNRNTKEAQRILENWPVSGKPSSAEQIGNVLDGLGWKNLRVEEFRWNADAKLALYTAVTEFVPTGPANPLHYIAEFGSHMQKARTYVACIYGTTLKDRLLSIIKKLDALDGHKILLVDCALSQSDRRAIARELKQKEFGCHNTYLIVDRVLLCYLLDRYKDSSINRMLVALAMPFSYAQPYVVESNQTMPPEIFIGRKDELEEIKRHDGTNLIYGGRQLGKSALLKKARDDMDGDQGKRAILVDIREKDCATAALRLSQELRELNVIPDMTDTTEWSVLCSKIRSYLRSPGCPITYLLVMLDEADTFIADCANYSYRPLAELKDVQQSLPGRFKYVLAGLHDVVRFNREVALGRNSVITHMSAIKITPFQPEVAEKLLTEPMSCLGIAFPDKVIVSQILAATNYFPCLIQLYCEKLIQSIREIDYAGYNMDYVPPYHVTEDHLKQILMDKSFTDQIQHKLEITLRLDDHYFPLALLMRYMYSYDPQSVKKGYTASVLLDRARDLKITALAGLTTEKMNALMEELQDLNVFRSTVDHDTYLLANKNFRDLLGADEEVLNNLIPYIGE